MHKVNRPLTRTSGPGAPSVAPLRPLPERVIRHSVPAIDPALYEELVFPTPAPQSKDALQSVTAAATVADPADGPVSSTTAQPSVSVVVVEPTLGTSSSVPSPAQPEQPRPHHPDALTPPECGQRTFRPRSSSAPVLPASPPKPKTRRSGGPPCFRRAATSSPPSALGAYFGSDFSEDVGGANIGRIGFRSPSPFDPHRPFTPELLPGVYVLPEEMERDAVRLGGHPFYRHTPTPPGPPTQYLNQAGSVATLSL